MFCDLFYLYFNLHQLLTPWCIIAYSFISFRGFESPCYFISFQFLIFVMFCILHYVVWCKIRVRLIDCWNVLSCCLLTKFVFHLKWPNLISINCICIISPWNIVKGIILDSLWHCNEESYKFHLKCYVIAF